MTPIDGTAVAGALVPWTTTSVTRIAEAQLAIASNRYEHIGRSAVVAVYGPPGLGKTTLAARAADTHYTADGRSVVKVTLTARPSRNELATLILHQLGAVTPKVGYRLRADAIDLLTGRRVLLVIDEAHHMGTDTLRDVKTLSDQLPQTDVWLIGTSDLVPRLATVPEMNDRVTSRVELSAMTLDEVLDVIPHAHPLLTHAPPELITAIDRSFAFGRWRPWCQFIETATHLAQLTGGAALTDDLIENTITDLGGWRDQDIVTPPASRRRRNRT